MPWEKQFDRRVALDRAMQAFWERGYEATSVQDLLDCMEINRGSLYATFGDKHALFVEALKMYDVEVRGRLLSQIRSRFPPRQAIRKLLESFASDVDEGSPGRGCFLTNTALELAAHDPVAREIVGRSQEDLERFFREVLAEGQRDGTVNSHLIPQEAARGLLASFIGLVVLSRSRPEVGLLRSIVEDALGRLE